ncbi:MAG: TfoX/Sxy family protein [Asgard group archaeon]|nr:TfoX/Sxy family protein [Asgard group archaeon]
MRKYEKPSEELSFLLDELTQFYNCSKRKMFGCPSYFVNGNMFAGVFEDTIYLRLSEEDQIETKEQFEDINQFEPLTGRKMREYIAISENLWQDVSIVKSLLAKAYSYASSLPVKQKKKK